MKKRLIWCVCAVCFALILIFPCAAVLCQDVYVEKAAHLADWQAALRDSPVPFSENGADIDGTAWYYTSDASDAAILGDGERLAVSVTEAAGSAVFRYTGNLRLNLARALSFGVYLTDDKESAHTYTVTVTCRGGDGETVYHAEVPANTRSIVHCAASGLPSTLTTLTLTVTYAPEDAPERIELMPPCLTDREPWYVTRYLASAFTEVVGHAQCVSDEGLYLFPDANGDVTVTAGIVQTAQTYPSGERVLNLLLDGVSDGGQLTCSVTGENGETISAKVVRVADGMVYRIPIGNAVEEGELSWRAYTLRFEDVVPADGVSFLVRSVSVGVYAESGTAGVSIVGGLEKYALTLGGSAGDRQLDCSGKIRRELVREYNKDSIVLLALPDGIDGEVLTLAAEPVANTFDFRVAFAPLPEKADTWLYTVAIRTTDAAGETRYLYLTKPAYFQSSEPTASTVSMLGLENASAMGVYESNVSHVIVDVPLNTLLTIPFGEKSVFCRRGDSVVSLNLDFLTQLDGDIPFYTKAGLEIWLRITSDTPISGLTYDSVAAVSYMPHLADTHAEEMYGAILSFLTERYSGIAGFILGRGLNCEKYVGARLTDTVMEELGELAAYTYRVASAKSQDIMIVLPYSDGYTYGGDALRCPDAVTYNPEGVCAKVSAAMDAKGDTAWLFGWYFHEDTSAVSAVTSAVSASLGENDAFSGIAYFWEPDNTPGDKANLVGRYDALAASVSRDKPRAVVLSLRRIYSAVAQKTYAAINGIGSEERSVVNLTAAVGDLATELVGRIRLWDFSDLYHNDNWLAGGGISSLITDYSATFSAHDDAQERSLQSVMPVERYADTDEGIAGGILLGDFDMPVDCRSVSDLCFTIAVRGTDRPVTLVFLVGAEDCRAEYSIAPITADGVYTVHCDLTEYAYAANVEYVGILIYAESDVTLEVSRVTAGSDTEDGATLLSHFHQTNQTTTGSRYSTYVAYFVVLVVIFTACTIALLSRRDREEAERAENEEPHRHPTGSYHVR